MPSSYPPSLGGVEELTRHLALALMQAGDQVEVWTGQPDDAASETAEVRDGLVVRRLPMPLPATNWSAIRRSATTGTRTLFSLRSAVAAFRPDVIHVQCFGPNGVYATALARMTGLPLVITLQGETVMDDADIFEVSRSLRAALRRGMRSAAAVTACSAFTLADAQDRFGLAPGKGQVIANGVELFEYNEGTPIIERPIERPADRPYIFAVGRLVEKKGFDLLLDAFARMETDYRTVDLVVGGSGPALADLQARSAELGVTHQVRFVGPLNREEVAASMAGAELFVLPSRLEPFGIVLLEAWRAGVAVVATNRGGPRELVNDGEDGLLVDPFDGAGFASVLVGLLGDHDRRVALAAAGRVRVADYAWPRIAQLYRQVYASVTVGHGPSDPRRDRHAAPEGQTVR